MSLEQFGKNHVIFVVVWYAVSSGTQIRLDPKAPRDEGLLILQSVLQSVLR